MLARLISLCLLAGLASAAQALDFRSVSVPAAILYDAPSATAKKLYLIKAQTPVEVVLRNNGWLKIRDAEGTLAWVEAKNLAERRTLVVTAARGEIRQAEKNDAPLVAELEKWVAVDFVQAAAPGWVKVRHRDGVTGFIRATQVWGL